MLLQLGLTLVLTVKVMLAPSSSGAEDLVSWAKNFLLATTVATGLMTVGAAWGIGELSRVGQPARGVLLATIGFAIATAALLWSYHALSSFLDLANDPDIDLDGIVAAAEDLDSLAYLALVKDIGYGLGLILLLRTVQRSAAANEQLTLRDDAGHMSRAIIVMLIGDIFYQLTYNRGGDGFGSGMFSLIINIGLAIFWIWCHVKLVQFFENAAHFVNEPHELPNATVVKVPDLADLKPKPPIPRQSRPSMPAAPIAPPIVVVPPPAAPIPRAATADDAPSGDGPTFLR